MGSQVHGKHQTSPTLSLPWVPAPSLGSQMPSAPTSLAPAGPPSQEGLSVVIALPEAERGSGQLQGGMTAEQLLHFLLEASPSTPAQPVLSCLSPPCPPPVLGWPACPAPLPGPAWALVHLSGTRCLIKPPRKQGQPVGAEEGAALGHVWPRGFFGPCSNRTPPENWGLGYLT